MVLNRKYRSIARPRGYTVPMELIGHGIGEQFHQGPGVIHCGK